MPPRTCPTQDQVDRRRQCSLPRAAICRYCSVAIVTSQGQNIVWRGDAGIPGQATDERPHGFPESGVVAHIAHSLNLVGSAKAKERKMAMDFCSQIVSSRPNDANNVSIHDSDRRNTLTFVKQHTTTEKRMTVVQKNLHIFKNVVKFRSWQICHGVADHRSV